MPFAKLAVGGIGEAGELAIFKSEITIRAHDFVAGEIGVVGGENGLHVWKSADELHNFARHIEMVVGVEFVEVEQGDVFKVLAPVVEPFKGFGAAGGDFVEIEWSIFMFFEKLLFSSCSVY